VSRGSGSGNPGGSSARGRRSTQGARPRPGQHSSGLRGTDHTEDRAKGRTGDRVGDRTKDQAEGRAAGRPQEQAGEGSTRRTGGEGRRRRRPSNNPSS
jgi:hypothetical protein